MNIIKSHFEQVRQEVINIVNEVERFGGEEYQKESELKLPEFIKWKEDATCVLGGKISAALKSVKSHQAAINERLEQMSTISARDISADVALFNVPGLRLSERDINAMLQRNLGNEIIRRLVQKYISEHSELDLQKIVEIKTIQDRIAASNAVFFDIESTIGNCDISQRAQPQYFAYALKNFRDNWDLICGDKIAFVTTP